MGMGPLERTEFPGFWEDAKQHNMHWTVYTIGLAAVASLVWVLMLPALMMFVLILPGTIALLMGVQYSVSVCVVLLLFLYPLPRTVHVLFTFCVVCFFLFRRYYIPFFPLSVIIVLL